MELESLRKHQLKDLQRQVCAELKRRYARNRAPLYGQLNKGFTDEELQHFLGFVRNRDAKLVFELMAYLGLSVSEACRIKQIDLDLQQRRLWIRSAKGRHPTMIFLCDRIYRALRSHMPRVAGEEYLIPRQDPSCKWPHISPDWVRCEFRDSIVASGLDFVYAESTESYDGRPVRHLHRLTTHSLRHYFITRVHEQSRDLLITQRLARHKNVRNTERYVFTSQTELDRAIVSTFAE